MISRLLICSNPLPRAEWGWGSRGRGAPGTHRERPRCFGLQPPPPPPGQELANSCSLEQEVVTGACGCRRCCPGPGVPAGAWQPRAPRPRSPARSFPLTSCVMAPPAYRHKEAASASSAELFPLTLPRSFQGCSAASLRGTAGWPGSTRPGCPCPTWALSGRGWRWTGTLRAQQTRGITPCDCNSPLCASQKLCRDPEFRGDARWAELYLQVRVRVDAVCKGPASSWVIIFLCFLFGDQSKPLAQLTAATLVTGLD